MGFAWRSLENQIQQITQLLKDKDATIDEQQRLLAQDRDIRELMGARDLYFAEAYDVGTNGEEKETPRQGFFSLRRESRWFSMDMIWINSRE